MTNFPGVLCVRAEPASLDYLCPVVQQPGEQALIPSLFRKLSDGGAEIPTQVDALRLCTAGARGRPEAQFNPYAHGNPHLARPCGGP